MKEVSLVSCHIVKDYMVSNKLKAHQVEINMEMIKAVRSASLKYKTCLEENRKLQAMEEENVIMLLDQEILGLEENKKVLQEVCKT